MEGDASPVFRGCIRGYNRFLNIKMVVAMNRDAISIIQQQADTDDNADSDDDFYDDVIA